MPRSAQPPTLYDVAREAGVSLATASRVLNGSSRVVAASYRERVLAVADRLGYRANMSAQAVARGTSSVVAVLVSDLADPYFAEIAAGATRAADERGLLVTIAETQRDPGREARVLRQLAGLRPRLFVLTGSPDSSADAGDAERALLEVEAAGSRVVSVGRSESARAAVEIANEEGARELARHLVAAGVDEVAILAGPETLATAISRREGFERGLREAGGRVVAVEHGGFDRAGGEAAVARLLERTRAMRAVFAVNDVMALGALAGLRAAGVSVPEEIGVAGFDDIPAARDVTPALTSVNVDLEALGNLAVRVGLGEVVDPDVVPAAPILRESTALG